MKCFLRYFLLTFTEKTLNALHIPVFSKKRSTVSDAQHANGRRISIGNKKNALPLVLKKSTLKLIAVICFLFLGVKSASANITYGAASTAGFATSPLTASQAGVGIFGFSANSSGNYTMTQIDFTSNIAPSNYFSNFKLYVSTTNSLASAIAGGVLSTTFVNTTTTAFSATINKNQNGFTTYYYFVVADFTLPATAGMFQMGMADMVRNTGTTYNGPITGTNYTITPPLVLGTAMTAGLATANQLNSTQGPVGILGFSITTNVTTTVNSMAFSAAIAPASTIGTFFSNVQLYVSNTNSFAAATLVTGTTVSALTGTIFTISGLTQAINSTTRYYFIEANYTQPASGSSTFQLSATSVTTSTPATFTSGGPINGISYTLTCPTVTATDLTGASLTGTSLYLPQTNIAVAGVSFVMNTSTTTLSQLVFTVPQSVSTAFNYFANPPTLVTCPTSSYSAGTATVVTTSGNSFTGTTFTFNISPATTVSTTASYYFLVLNYSVTGGVLPQTFTFNPTSYTTAFGTVNPVYTANTYTCIGAPSLSYSAMPYTYVQGTVTTISISNSGGAPTSAYAETGTLPTGITFSTASGQFAIAANATVGTYTFTVNASNPAGSSTPPASISITINPKAPVISYFPSSYTFYTGVGGTTSAATNTGGTATYSVDATTPFPPYLSINSSTGVITGSTSAVTATATIYKIDATNVTGSSSANVTITVVAQPSLSYTATPYTYVQGTVTTISISNSGGAPTSAYAETGTLPTGITFSTASGQFAIAANATVGTYTFTVNASNPAGSSVPPASISITINPKAPVISYTTPNTWIAGTTYTLTPTNSGGAVSTWSYTGTLPPGILFDNVSGNISGNPTTPGSYSVTVTGSNVTSSSNKTVAFTVDYPNPVISYSPVNPYLSGASINLAVTNSESALTTGYSYTGTLPGGVTLNTSTGDISGTVPTVTTSTTYTVIITASTGSSTGSTTVSIIVNPLLPNISYASPDNLTQGTAMTLNPGNSGGAVGAAGSYSSTVILNNAGNGINKPYGMAVDAAGNLYVANFSGNSIVEYTNTGTVNTYNIGAGTGPVGIVFDSSGNAYVLEQTIKNVVEYAGGNLSGTANPVITTGFTTPIGIAIDASNNLYISDSGNNKIYKYASSGGAPTLTITPPNDFFTQIANVTGGVAVDASGNIYAGDNALWNLGTFYYGAAVDEYNAAGTYLTSFTGGTTPSGLSIDSQGNIYLSDASTGNITLSTPLFASTTLTETGFGSPRGVISDANGNFYVSDYNNNTVTKFSKTGGYTLSGTLPRGLSFSTSTGIFSGTPQTAFSSVTLTVTAANITGSSIAAVSFSCVANPPVISYTPSINIYQVGVGITPLGPLVSGGQMIAAGYGAGTTLSGATLNGPWGMTTDAGGNIWVVNYNAATVIKYSPAGAFLKNYTVQANPTGVAVDASGNFYVTNVGGAVYKYNPAGTGAALTNTIEFHAFGVSNAYGIAIDASGNLYIADEGDGIIWKSNSTGSSVTEFVTKGNGGLSQPAGIAVDASGNVYVTDLATKALPEYGPTGTFEGTVVSGLNTPYSLNVDSYDDYFVGDSGPGTVSEYAGAGTFAASITGITNPRGLTMDSSGNIYVADYTHNTVTKYSPYQYILSGGTLPAGLSFNTANGTFTGTPIAVFPTTTFTVSVYGSYGNASTTVTITCATGPVFSYLSPQTFTVGTAIPTLSPAVSSGGPIVSASVSSPSLPAGLSVDASGNITGTPAAATATTTYTIFATNSYGFTGTTTVVITCVNPPAPVVAYTTPDVYTTGIAIATLDPNNTGGTAIWSISTALPAGLNFDTATGLITGIPTAISPATDYLVTATNAGGTVSETINITCNPPAPVITYITPDVYITGIAIVTLDPNNTGGGATWSISAPLPGGLNFDTSTGLITGTPVVISPATDYLVTAANGGGTVSETINITCNPPAPVIAYTTPNVYLVGVAIAPLSPVNTGGPIISYSIIPALPPGLSYDATTGIISGTPTAATSVTNYYVTATNAGGTGTFTIVITVNLAMPVITYITPDVFTVGTTITPLIPANTGSTPTGYSISPVLPAGLSFDTTTGIIYGTPSAVSAASDYVITAANGGGSGTFTVNITVNAPGPVIAYATPDLFPVGTPIAPLSPVSTGSAPAGYAISAALPAGLNFDTTTGIISGIPTVVTAATIYTVTATNSIGTGTATITISCNSYTDWLGSISNDWNTPGNWAGGIVPAGTDIAAIGVNVAFTNFPNVGPLATTVDNVGSVIIGTNGGQAGGFAVTTGSTLNVTGAITYQSDLNSALPYTASISGGGIVNSAGINVIANTTLTPVAASYTENLTTSVNNLNLTNDITLTSSDAGGNSFNSTFTVIGGTVQVLGTIQTTNSAAGTSTFTVTPSATATLQLANTAPLAGLSATGTNVINFDNPGATIEYSGSNQTFYTDAPITGLATGPSYNNIKFSGNGIKTPNGNNTNNLFIDGDFTNALVCDIDDYADLGSPEVIFDGTTQNIYGGSGTGTVFYNTTFSGTGTTTIQSGNVSIASSGILTMSGSSAVLAANGLLTLNSDATGSATVAAIPAGCSITGNVNVQRFITGGANHRGYRLLSSPVYAATVSSNNVYSINYLINSCYIKGTTGTAGGFDGAGNPNIFLFRENLAPSNTSFTSGNYRGINTLGAAPNFNYLIDNDPGIFNIPSGNGFLFFFRGDRNLASYATETATNYVPTSATLAATGSLNQGPVTMVDWYTPGSANLGWTTIPGNAKVQGFNLAGNPYSSSIDWNTYNTSMPTAGIYAPNVAPFSYILDPVSQNFSVYSALIGNDIGTIATANANIIPSGQGFFVVALKASAQLVFNEISKSNIQASAPNGNLFLGAPGQAPVSQYLHLKLTRDSVNNKVNTDGIFIVFNKSADKNYSPMEDAPYKTGNGGVNLSSMSADGIPLAINQMPFPVQSQKIALTVKAANDGLYQLNMISAKSIPAIFNIWLKDVYKKDSIDIRAYPVYSFNIDKNDTTSYGSNRFSLVMKEDTALGLRLLNFTATKVSTGVQIVWKTENEENYTNFTVERSTDAGASYNVLGGFVSYALGTYSLLDKNPLIGANQYRLKLEDLNGAISYSNVVILIYGNGDNSFAGNLNVYPNPSIDVIHLMIPFNGGSNSSFNLPVLQTIATIPGLVSTSSGSTSSYDIKIISSSGAVMKTATSSSTNWEGSVNDLMPGTYIVQVVNNTNKKLVGRNTFVKL